MDDYFKENESIKGYIPEIDYKNKSIFSPDLFPNFENLSMQSNINEINENINPFPFPFPSPYEQLDDFDVIPSGKIMPEPPKKKFFIEISKDETQEKSNKEPPRNNLLGKKIKNPSLKKKNKKKHDKYDNDNILRKIYLYSVNFILTIFMNVVIEECHLKKGSKYDDYKFVGINGDYKKKIRRDNFDEYKNKTISDLLNLQNNGKYSNKNRNKELLDNILKNNKNNAIFNKIINKKYIDIFKEVYYKNKKDIIYEGLSLNLQTTFDDYFLDEIQAKEGYYKEKIDKVIKELYFPGIFTVKKKRSSNNKSSHGNGKNPLINGYGINETK